MYRYDDYDRQMLQDRIAQFRDQTRRFLAGELEGGQFLPLRLQNGADAENRDSVRLSVSKTAAQTGLHSTLLRQRLRTFFHAPERSVQLAEAAGSARYSCSPR